MASRWVQVLALVVAGGLTSVALTGQSQAAAPAPPASTTNCATGGSGGPATNVTNQSFTSGSATSKYHLYAKGLDTTKPVGLLLHMHGDGAYDFKHPEYSFDGMAQHAASSNLIAMSMLTPDSRTTTWWRDGES